MGEIRFRFDSKEIFPRRNLYHPFTYPWISILEYLGAEMKLVASRVRDSSVKLHVDRLSQNY